MITAMTSPIIMTLESLEFGEDWLAMLVSSDVPVI